MRGTLNKPQYTPLYHAGMYLLGPNPLFQGLQQGRGGVFLATPASLRGKISMFRSHCCKEIPVEQEFRRLKTISSPTNTFHISYTSPPKKEQVHVQKSLEPHEAVLKHA